MIIVKITIINIINKTIIIIINIIFNEGNMLCVEFNKLNLNYLSIYSSSLLVSLKSNRFRVKNIKLVGLVKAQLIEFLPECRFSLFRSRCFTSPYFDVP